LNEGNIYCGKLSIKTERNILVAVLQRERMGWMVVENSVENG